MSETMSVDGYSRWVDERGQKIQKKVADAEQERSRPTHVDLELVPEVRLIRRTVRLSVGRFWFTFGVQTFGDAFVAVYQPATSNPPPMVDPTDPALARAAEAAYLQASGRVSPVLEWDYSGSLGPDGLPKPGQTSDQLATLRALMRMDDRGAGKVLATREDVQRAIMTGVQ